MKYCVKCKNRCFGDKWRGEQLCGTCQSKTLPKPKARDRSIVLTLDDALIVNNIIKYSIEGSSISHWYNPDCDTENDYLNVANRFLKELQKSIKHWQDTHPEEMEIAKKEEEEKKRQKEEWKKEYEGMPVDKKFHKLFGLKEDKKGKDKNGKDIGSGG